MDIVFQKGVLLFLVVSDFLVPSFKAYIALPICHIF